ncbi:ADP-ribosyl cyclase/cyclic ADP-ribose hydrolase 1-like [Erinaceus europaeus]|uniref:ADP-ribosyl cyclase/cyclic ADP-ribose hydrolase 1 n=1 Tax=Erinaceus europaeus TaxID=9365 RepID=A0ABM3X719_ERIEU|nr:ADP-ribosyl cyclase/cyclic ADP-ribose hydrolase 1-like [Erinaceus europaeus]
MGVKALALHFVLLFICGGFRGLQCFFLQTILKRCQSYDASENPELRNRDCSKIVEAFKGAFVSKDPCGITERDYAPLLQLTDQNVPNGKALLWSNTKGEKQQYSQKKGLLTLENMLLGHLADGLTWCGEKGSPEIDTTSCPDRNSCKGNPVSVSWDTASKWVSTCRRRNARTVENKERQRSCHQRLVWDRAFRKKRGEFWPETVLAGCHLWLGTSLAPAGTLTVDSPLLRVLRFCLPGSSALIQSSDAASRQS